MAYAKTVNVAAGDDATADAYDSLRSEMKAGAENLVLHDSDIAVTYNGGSNNDLPDTVTYVDNDGSTDFDIDAVATITYTDDLPTQVATVFSKLGVTMTEAITYDGNGNPTGVTRTLT